MSKRPIKIAIMALGGQGGGVLSDWIIDLVERAGYLAQSTSVPGVAQRTGATIYYIEAFPAAATAGAEPVMALMPVPGDVDIVIAAELMEAGRAVLRGLVSKELTTVIASTHRIYAIGEKSALGDGRARDDRVLAAVRRDAKVLVGFDMEALANEVGGVISAPLFGALAGSGALPIDRVLFEETIREAGVAVETNLKAFAAAFEIAKAGEGPASRPSPAAAEQRPRAAGSGPIVAHIRKTMPRDAQDIVIEGARRCADYQGLRYAELYLSRLFQLQAACRREAELKVLVEVARHLALWMTYEDAIRVADLKTRKGRFDRVRSETGAKADQVIEVSEFLHPRVEEVCDILPAPIGRFVLARRWARKTVSILFSHGRRVHTTRLRGFLQLYAIAMLRPSRPGSLRYRETQKEIEAWLARIAETLPSDPALATEIAASQRLLKGYGDTHARGQESYARIVAALDAVRRTPDPARSLRGLCDAALADEHGQALRAALEALHGVRAGVTAA